MSQTCPHLRPEAVPWQEAQEVQVDAKSCHFGWGQATALALGWDTTACVFDTCFVHSSLGTSATAAAT